MRRSLPCLALAGILVLAAGWTPTARSAEEDAKPPKREAPQVAGDWTGTWSIAGREGQVPPMRLDAKVKALKGDRFEATFEGECGRPYKYTVRMLGRRAGNVVLFKGTADLGEQDGGVYDWIGRATEKEFQGFYTSEGYTGSFRLARAAQVSLRSKPR